MHSIDLPIGRLFIHGPGFGGYDLMLTALRTTHVLIRGLATGQRAMRTAGTLLSRG